jgi:four helix bundle protein
MRNYKELEIWRRSMKMVNEVYQQCKLLPNDEKYGLNSQILRSAVSIPSNIAEGCSRSSKKEFARFLEISLGSAFELETQLLIAIEANMLDTEKVKSIISELNDIQRMTNSYRSNTLKSI